MTKSGLRTVDYATGWSNRVDVAARRAVVTGLSQLTAKVNEQNMDDLETEYVEVSWHSGARPSHQQWQGKWYTHAQLISVCGLGEVDGLCGANCYHDYYPVIPGISEPTYTPEQLAEMNKAENTPMTDEVTGKKYTKYEALQRQRRLETQMRADRQTIKLLQDAGSDEDDIVNARCRYQGHSQEYTRFSKAMDLPQQRARVQTDGLGNIGVRRTKKNLDKSGESGIIKEEKLNIFNRIKSVELPLDINTGNQNKHISTSHSYDKDKKKSILYGDLNSAKELVDKYHGTGELRFTSKGKWTNKEFVEVEQNIGEVFDEKTGRYIKTNRFAIHYGKNGTHVVPMRRNE